MPLYELRCGAGHRFEVLQPFAAPLPACGCGAATAKVPASFGIGGTAATPPPPERMPQTWKGTYGGDREYVTALRRTAEQRRDLEARNPDLAGDRRPVIAHEGRFEGAPLRAGDVGAAGGGAGGGHAHPHGGASPGGTGS